MLDVAEMFVSINGEGTHAGQLAVFVRFRGCNLRCSYCDTMWANQSDTPISAMTAEEIYDEIHKSGIYNVTLTGGEPLNRDGIHELMELLSEDSRLYVEIETNGSIPLKPFLSIENRPSMTMDYKLPSSGREKSMCYENLELLDSRDTVKFVAGSIHDLERAKTIIEEYNLIGKCAVYISPVFGKIEPSEIVEFMKLHRMNGVTLQLQMHKIIWDPDEKGV